MTQRPFTLQPVDPFSGRPLGPAVKMRPPLALIEEEAPPPPSAAAAEDPYPEAGNIADVLAWVDDPSLTDAVRSDRAKAAIVAEHGREKSRKTLLQELDERTG